MAVELPETDANYCERCGRPDADDVHGTCHLDPPRFCRRCGRRLKVQVFPDHYDARCIVCDAGGLQK